MSNGSFTYSVYDRFELKETNNIMVIGHVTGTIKKGCEICAINPGDDVKKQVVTEVLGLEVGDGKGGYSQVMELTDGMVGVMLKDCSNENIKPGTVLYSKDSDNEAIHSAYIKGIGDAFVQHRGMQINEIEYKLMSVTDLAEAMRLYNFVLSMNPDLTEADAKIAYDRLMKTGAVIIKKLMELDHIYVLINKETNEPHMFSRTVKKGEGYECTNPSIMLITEAYYDDYAKKFEGSEIELRKIENGSDKKGIYNFLGQVFYINGAIGVSFMYDTANVSRDIIVPAPKYDGMREVDIPVTNPDLKRWILLLGQLQSMKGKMKDEEYTLLFNLYFRFASLEMPKARFLVPMKIDDSDNGAFVTKKDGTMTLNQGMKFQIVTQPGKGEKPAVCMYTDWNMLRQAHGDEWQGAINTIDQMIDSYDIAINATKFPAAGFYLTSEMYDAMKKA